MARPKRSRVVRESAKRAKFTLNEPAKAIAGGNTRPSVRLDSRLPDAVVRRIRLNRLMLVHDPDGVDKMLAQVEPDDLPILRIMAQETALSGNEPAVRHHAIFVLGRFPTVENLDVLFELSQSREGVHVRTAARNALAATGLAAALPHIKEGLLSRDAIEVRGTELAIGRLFGAIGPARARAALLGDERRAPMIRAITALLDTLGGRTKPPARRRGSSRED